MIVRTAHLIALPLMALALQGCLAKAAVDVATAPVRIGSKAVDLATTSQSEADEKRGREIRKREERLAKLDRRLREQEDDCLQGDDKACREAVVTRREMDQLLPTVPVERDD
jgi:predicted Holliday junction resolvase-like endonuclease